MGCKSSKNRNLLLERHVPRKKISDFVVAGPYKYFDNPMYGLSVSKHMQLQCGMDQKVWFNSGFFKSVFNFFYFFIWWEKKFIVRISINRANVYWVQAYSTLTPICFLLALMLLSHCAVICSGNYAIL